MALSSSPLRTRIRSHIAALISGLVMVGLPAHFSRAEDLFTTAANNFFHSEDYFKRVGIEMEFSGLGFEKITELLRGRFTISGVRKISDYETHLDTPQGVIKLKIEGQAWRYEGDDAKFAAQLAEDVRSAPREIVFPPLTYEQALPIQALSLDLKEAGAVGTRADHAVAFQVNYEWGSLRLDERRVHDLVNLLRTYYDPSNMKQIDEVLQVPGNRREFLNDLTPGFKKKLFSERYSPDLEEFFVDYLYRQSAERFGFGAAWTASLDELRAFLGRLKDPVHPDVIKMQRVRISSLLLEAFPEDPLVKEVKGSRWAVPAPIIEFREFNMVFPVVDLNIRMCLGLVNSVRKFGYYKHDQLMSELSGVPESDFARIRRIEAKGEPFIVRYLLEDPKTTKMRADEKTVAGSKALWTQLGPEHPGQTPLVIGGESIIFNRRHIHRTSIIGKYNPGLDHGYIQQILENKLTEAKLFGRYAPGSMPDFIALRDLMKVSEKGATPLQAFKAATKHFPNGWVMKGSWDLGTEKSFISNQIDVQKAMESYRNGFEAHRQRVIQENPGRDPEYVAKRLKEHPGYMGWKIQSILEKPDQVFFQSLIPIDREFRVEVLDGKVIRGATIDRYAYTKKNAKPPEPAELEAVENFTQKILDDLPFELKVLPYGLDVARLKTGGFKIIETNPGGNSSFLEESLPSVKAFEKALFAFRDDAIQGKIKRLTPRQEMSWIFKEFEQLKISPKRDYPGMVLMQHGIFDPEYFPRSQCTTLLRPDHTVAAGTLSIEPGLKAFPAGSGNPR